MKFLKLLAMVSLFAVVALTPMAAHGQFLFEENPLLGKQAPDFRLKTVDGKELSLSEFRNSCPTMIFFWATWCGVCHEELQMLRSQAEEIEKAGIKVALVDIEENPKKVKSYLAKNKLSFQVFIDEDGLVASQEYSVFGIPSIFMIDKNGVIKAMEHALPQNYMEILTADKKS